MSSYLSSSPYLGGSGTQAPGAYNPLLNISQRSAAIQAARLQNFKKPQKEKKHESLFDKVTPDILELALSQIATSLINTPAGLYDIGKAAVNDYRDSLHGDWTPERLGAIGKAMGESTWQDLQHPLRNPGYFAMDALAVGSLGAGTIARTGRTAAAIARATGGGNAATRLIERGARFPTSSGQVYGIMAPTIGDAFGVVRNSAVSKLKAAAEQRRLRLNNADRQQVLGFTPSTEAQPTVGAQRQLTALERQMHLDPNTGTTGLKRTNFTEQPIPDLAGEHGTVPKNYEEMGLFGHPVGFEPSGITAGPHEPLFPRENTATLMQGEVPLAQPQRLFPLSDLKGEPPPTGHLPTNPVPGPTLGPELRAADEARRVALEQKKAEMEARAQAHAERQAALKGPELPPALSFDVSQYKGAPWGLKAQALHMGPEELRARQAARAAEPGPVYDGSIQVSRETSEKAAATLESVREGLHPSDVKVVPNPATGVLHTHVGGRPTDWTAKVAPGVEPSVDATFHLYKGGIKVGEEEGVLAAGRALREHTISEMNPRWRESVSADAAARTVSAAGEQAVARGEQLAAVEKEATAPSKAAATGYKSVKTEGRDDKWEIHDPDGNPTGVTILRSHKSGGGIESFIVMDGDRPLMKVRGGRNAENQAVEYAKTRQMPGEEDVPEAGAVAEPAAADASAAVAPETPGTVEQPPAPKESTPKAEVGTSAKELEQTLTELQREEVNAIPEIYEHVYTSGDGTVVLRHKDRKNDVKVMDVHGELITGPKGSEEAAAWARYKREAEGSTSKKTANEVAETAKTTKPQDAENLKALDETNVAPELAKLGFSYSVGNFGMRLRDLRETFNITTPQAKEMQKTLFPLVRDLHEKSKVEGWTKPRLNKELQKALVDTYGKEIGDKAYGMIKQVSGNAPIGATEMAKIAFRAFTAAPPRKTIPIASREVSRKVTDAGPLPKGLSKEGLPDTYSIQSEAISTKVLASNNILMRSAARTYYGLLQSWDRPYAKGGRGNFANRRLVRKINFENREIGRAVMAAESAGITETARALQEKLDKTDPKDVKATMAKMVDSTNQLAQIGILFLKPAYVSANLIGQFLLSLNDHSWNPINVQKSVGIQRELFRNGELAGKRAKLIKKLMGEGFVSTSKTGKGFGGKIERGHSAMSQFYAKILDTPFRDNAFINEARRQGYTDAKSIGELLDKAMAKGVGSAEHDRMVDITRRANRNLVDYGRLSDTEKAFIRRVIFFYPWIKGATIYGARYAAEHPAGFAVQAQMGRQEAMAQAKELGPVPSYLQGSFQVGTRTIPGLGKVPTLANPQSVSILGTLGESSQILQGLISGSPLQSQTLGEMITPAASSAVSMFFNIDPFTGRKLPPGQGGFQAGVNTALKTPAIFRLQDQLERADQISSGERNAGDFLQPASRSEALGRFLGPGLGAIVGHPLADVALNPKEAHSRAAAETRSIVPKTEATKLRFQDNVNQAQAEAARVGVKLGPDFRKAMALQSEREQNLTTYETLKPGKMNIYDRLVSDLSLLVRMKKISNAKARELAITYANADRSTIESFRRDLGESYFQSSVTSAYRKYLTGAGATVQF